MVTTDYLMNIRRIMKLHEGMLKQICVKYDLTLIEANIISFLHNNPEKDTAGDIVELRMLSKGNVSQGVELLSGKGLLLRIPDKEDRRKVHLSLSEKAFPITEEIELEKRTFQEELFSGFSEDDKKTLEDLSRRIMENTEKALKRREKK
ncbi:MAG: MarR family transcriptional regulator [Eubacteriales bacterium]|nr:MarR family transcriptional regulator [Eubacteriales bacterium]